MASDASGVGYKIWAADDVVYGPVELPELVSAVKDGRVTAETWVFSEKDDHWVKAPQVPELRIFFRRAAAPVRRAASGGPIKPAALRRVKILGNMSDADLERFVTYMELVPVGQWTTVVKQGDHGDAMYLVLEGELRVRMMVGGKETTLATLSPGEFFGEISLFDHGPRSADVIANESGLLLRISTAAFERMLKDAPELAAPFVYAVSQTLTARIRADNKRYRDSIQFARAISK